MNTHEIYVSLEVAKLLKEAGFDWEVKFFYRDGILRNVLPDELFNGDFKDVEYYYKHIGIPHQSLDYNDGSSKFLEEYSAPTLDVAQRWLREVKHCFVNVNIDIDDNECEDTIVVEPFTCKYIIEGFPYCNNSPGDDYIRNVHGDNKYFDTYEEALEAGIKKALELILEKGKSNL